MLKIKNLSKRFGGIKAVNGASFEIKKGEISALIGPNGSGKTTVFNLICGIIKPDSGEVYLDKENITRKNISTISNKGVSRLFQQSRLFFNLSVEENLLIALSNDDLKFWKNLFGYKYSKEDYEKVRGVAEFVGIKSLLNKTSRDLSFGQKRLVEIARAIIKPHKLLILDEPIAGVNPKLRLDISKILKKLKKEGETVFVIEHDMNFVLNISDNVVVMDEGRVIAQGTPAKIKNNKKVLEAYLGD
jgi:ABC-type branched-subunit amino acid transport system ATPase component